MNLKYLCGEDRVFCKDKMGIKSNFKPKKENKNDAEYLFVVKKIFNKAIIPNRLNITPGVLNLMKKGKI